LVRYEKRKGQKEIYKSFWWGKLKEIDCSDDGRIILKWIRQ